MNLPPVGIKRGGGGRGFPSCAETSARDHDLFRIDGAFGRTPRLGPLGIAALRAARSLLGAFWESRGAPRRQLAVHKPTFSNHFAELIRVEPGKTLRLN
jgi:hypothetical protein